MSLRRRKPPYGLMSLLLLYPDGELLAARDEIVASVAALTGSREKRFMLEFLRHWAVREPSRLQQEYVSTFDLQRRCGLYLTYYVEGDTRKRGMALLRLNRMYRAAGLEKEEGELPDFLPLMLEFAELAPAPLGRGLLAEHRPSLELVRHRLLELESPYAALLEAVCADLPALSPLQRSDLARLAAEGPPAEQVGLQPFAPPEVMPAMEPRA